jgi:hypothetical protein
MLASHSFRRFSLLSAFATLAMVAACGSGSGNGNSGGGGSGGSGASTATGSGGNTSSTSSTTSTGTGAAPECLPPGYGGGEQPIPIDSAQVTVVDLAGAPIVNAEVQLCGIDLCLYGQTNASGSVTIPNTKPDGTLVAPAVKIGDAFEYVKLAFLLSDPVSVFPELVTEKFPDTGPAIEPGKDAVSGDVTLSVPAGGAVVFDELIFDTPERQQLRTVTLPVDKEQAFLDPTLGIVQLYGATPIDTGFCPAAKVTVPNTAGLPADADVEFMVHGTNVLQEWAPYGQWLKVSDGKVSADGLTISTSPEGGLPTLQVFAIRLKP